MSELTFKLYSPLTAEFMSDGSEFWLGNDPIELQGYEMTDYLEAITAQIAEEGTNIEQYMDAEDRPYLAAHVKSIRISVEERDSELCACATVVVDEDLTERGWNDLQDYITGQYSDGWGEGFEQRDIEVEDGILNVHFWQEDHFAFSVEKMETGPQAGVVGQDALSVANSDRASRQPQPSQPDKKYEITDVAHPDYPELHRIRALRQVGNDVLSGELGGFVQSEANLSQGNDDAWLYDDSVSRDEACVCDDARLYEQAMAQDLALARGSVIMYGNAIACDNAIVTGGRIFDFINIIVDFGVLCRILGLGGLRRLEFLVRFLERLLDQADDKFLLGEFAVVDLLVAGQVVLDLLEEFLADLEGHCPCFAHCGDSFRVVLQDDLFDEFAHRAFVLLDLLTDSIM